MTIKNENFPYNLIASVIFCGLLGFSRTMYSMKSRRPFIGNDVYKIIEELADSERKSAYNLKRMERDATFKLYEDTKKLSQKRPLENLGKLFRLGNLTALDKLRKKARQNLEEEKEVLDAIDNLLTNKINNNGDQQEYKLRMNVISNALIKHVVDNRSDCSIPILEQPYKAFFKKITEPAYLNYQKKRTTEIIYTFLTAFPALGAFLINRFTTLKLVELNWAQLKNGTISIYAALSMLTLYGICKMYYQRNAAQEAEVIFKEAISGQALCTIVENEEERKKCNYESPTNPSGDINNLSQPPANPQDGTLEQAVQDPKEIPTTEENETPTIKTEANQGTQNTPNAPPKGSNNNRPKKRSKSFKNRKYS